ncbi:MAG: hypothetical protein AAFR37_21315, partial [Cyanobacteria bacterium J06628_3]
MAEETNSNTGGSFSGGNMDLSNSVFAPLFELPGIDGPEDIFGNIGAPTGNSTNEGDSTMDENNMQGGSDVNIGPFNRLLDIQGADGENLGPQDIFGNLGGSGGGNPFGDGGEGSEGSEGGPPADMDVGELPYGGSPFAGDNFWTLFNGGVNPADGGSGGGMPSGGGFGGGSPMGDGDEVAEGGNSSAGGFGGFGGGMPSFGSGDSESGGFGGFGGGMPSFGSGDSESGGFGGFGGGIPSFGSGDSESGGFGG